MTLTSDVHSPFDGVLLTSASKDLSRHVIVVTFILRSRQTNIEIDLRQANGAVRATSLFCLLGISLGFSSFFLYRLCRKFFPRRLLTQSGFPFGSRAKRSSEIDEQNGGIDTNSNNVLSSTNHILEKTSTGETKLSNRNVEGISPCKQLCTTPLSQCSQREKIAGGDTVSDWLTRNDGVMHNDFHIFPEICEAQASCELSRSRDLGFVSSNLVPGASTFGTRSINDFANTTCKSGNSRQSIQNSSSFNTSHDLDISNNPSSSISSEIVFAPDTGRSRAQSNMNEVTELCMHSITRNSQEIGANFSFQNRFHSTPDCMPGQDGERLTIRNRKRKSSSHSSPLFEPDYGASWQRGSHSDRSVPRYSGGSDFGETDIETPDSEVFAITKSEVGQSTLTNIEQLQSELQSLNDDVGEMSVEFEVLQKRENAKNAVARRYTLGTTEAVKRRHTRHKHLVQDDVMSKSCNVPHSRPIDVSPTDKRLAESADFLWDYQDGWDIDDQREQFLSDNIVYNMSDQNSMISGSSLERDSLRSAAEEKSVHDSSPHHNTSDMYIDDDPVAAEVVENLPPTSIELVSKSTNNPYLESVKRAADWNCSNFSPILENQNFLDFEKSNLQGMLTCLNCGNNINVVNNNVNINLQMMSPDYIPRVPPGLTWNGACCQKSSDHRDLQNSVARPGNAGLSHPQAACRWEVKNIGERNNIFQYVESGLLRRPRKAIRKGFHRICKLFKSTYLRSVRGDNFCALRAVIYQAFVNNFLHSSNIGSYVEQCKRLVRYFESPTYVFLKSWNFSNRLPYIKGTELETLKDCLSCFNDQIEIVSKLTGYPEREQYLTNLLNHLPEVDLKILEAVKVLMMLNVISFHEKYAASLASVPVFVWLLFERETSRTPDMFFQHHINPLGDSVHLQKLELNLLGLTLGLKIGVIHPGSSDLDDFISHFPDEGADGFGRIILIEEDINRYHVLTS